MIVECPTCGGDGFDYHGRHRCGTCLGTGDIDDADPRYSVALEWEKMAQKHYADILNASEYRGMGG